MSLSHRKCRRPKPKWCLIIILMRNRCRQYSYSGRNGLLHARPKRFYDEKNEEEKAMEMNKRNWRKSINFSIGLWVIICPWWCWMTFTSWRPKLQWANEPSLLSEEDFVVAKSLVKCEIIALDWTVVRLFRNWMIESDFNWFIAVCFRAKLGLLVGTRRDNCKIIQLYAAFSTWVSSSTRSGLCVSHGYTTITTLN